MKVAFVKFEMKSNSGKYMPWCSEAKMEDLITDQQEEKLSAFIKENPCKVSLKAAEFFAQCLGRTLDDVFPGRKEMFGKGSKTAKGIEATSTKTPCTINHDDIVYYSGIMDVSETCVL